MHEALFTKLHEQHKFPKPPGIDYNTNEYPENAVNKAALTKMSTALSSWITRVKAMIDKGKSFEDIHEKNLTISENDFREFKAWCDREPGKALSLWGKDQRALNLGTHNFGSGGYRGKKPNWAKEDAEHELRAYLTPTTNSPTSRLGT